MINHGIGISDIIESQCSTISPCLSTFSRSLFSLFKLIYIVITRSHHNVMMSCCFLLIRSPLMCLDTSLQITLYSKATFEDKFLGYISVPLSGFSLFGKPVTSWHPLTAKPNKPNKIKIRGEIEVTVCFVSSPENSTNLSRSKENLRKSNPTLLSNQDSEGSRRDLRDRIRRSFRRKKTPEQHVSMDLEALNISLKDDYKYTTTRPVSLAVSNGAAQRVERNHHANSSEKVDNFKYFQEDSLESEVSMITVCCPFFVLVFFL